MLTAAVTLLYRMVPTLPAFSYKPHSLVGSALSLLLVFRTNAAYTRFWEGRQRWQMLSDHVRSLARLVMIYETQVGHKRREQVARLLCAFPIVLKQYLRGYTLADSGVEKLLSETDRESLLRVRNGPLHVCNLLGKTLSAVPDTPESVEPHISFSARERLAMLGKVRAHRTYEGLRQICTDGPGGTCFSHDKRCWHTSTAFRNSCSRPWPPTGTRRTVTDDTHDAPAGGGAL